jgi:hypothetical protein
MSISAVRFLGRSVLALVAMAMLASGSAGAALVEGKNYARITNPQLVWLPALRGARAVSRHLAREAAG